MRTGIRQDLPDLFNKGMSGKTRKEARAAMQAMANTFLDYYEADAIYFTVSGDDAWIVDYYDFALTYDSQAKMEMEK